METESILGINRTNNSQISYKTILSKECSSNDLAEVKTEWIIISRILSNKVFPLIICDHIGPIKRVEIKSLIFVNLCCVCVCCFDWIISGWKKTPKIMFQICWICLYIYKRIFICIYICISHTSLKSNSQWSSVVASARSAAGEGGGAITYEEPPPRSLHSSWGEQAAGLWGEYPAGLWGENPTKWLDLLIAGSSDFDFDCGDSCIG